MRILIISIIVILLYACGTPKGQVLTSAPLIEKPVKPKIAKNVIFLIGDGMGVGQITAGTYANGNKTSLERFSVIGLHKPYSHNSLITDSAAAATSFACGVKTFNGAIGVDNDTLPVRTLLEEAEAYNMPTGLVASSTIVHATPASFIAHNVSRKNYEEIAADFLKTDIDYFVGGGKKYFDRRTDERDLVTELTTKGYAMGNFLEDFSTYKSKNNTANKIGYLTSDSDPLPVAQGRDYLIDASMHGIEFLDNKSTGGFFIMIESSQIDWGGHSNDEDYIISEFLEFDKLIGQVLDWAAKDGETLVVLTADHETGGFTIQPGSTMDSLVTTFTSTKHSGDFIPVFADGPCAEKFSGLYENTDIYHRIREAYGWE